ncbi:MAG: LegC family aminotransferase [Coriobacteriia bacterium]
MSDSLRNIPLSVPVVGPAERAYVDECMETGWLSTAGAFVTRFEDDVRAFTGARHAVACQSGTAALHVALRLAGVGPDDCVIVPSLTFVASVNPITYLGAHPVFVGCDAFMNVDADAIRGFLESDCERSPEGVVDRATGRRVAAILPVHVFGNPCDMEAIVAIADEWGLPIVEDAAESLGSSWTGGALAGRHAGTVGLAGCLSFNGNKIVTTGGGGMILADDADLAERARFLIAQAKTDPVRFVHDDVGYNYGMTNVHAAIGVGQLETLPVRIVRKRANHELYTSLLSEVPGVDVLATPDGTAPNYWFYSALVDAAQFGMDREGLMAGLTARGIQTRPVWYPNHRQKPYRDERTFAVERVEWFWERVLNLPCTHTLEREDIEYVCDAIRSLARS